MKDLILWAITILIYAVGLAVFSLVIVATGSVIFNFELPSGMIMGSIMAICYLIITAYNGIIGALAQKVGGN